MIRIRMLLMLGLVLPVTSHAAEARRSQYRGWPSYEMRNELIEVQVAPDIGGRVIQFKLGDFEYLWVNDQLAGKAPTANGLAPDGGWLNYGGDKLWPAPQGWDNDEQWPGPPDGVLDGSAHDARIEAESGTNVAVKVVSRKDKRSGIQFSRIIQIGDGVAHVSFDSTMTNIDDKPRRWGIWQVTQLNAANRQGTGYNKEIRCYTPINPHSRYPRGYVEMFGVINNPSFKVIPDPPMVVAHYQRLVGKIGVDNVAGWIATVDGTAGNVFVERFTTYADRTYPDNASVEFWMNGVGHFVCGTNLIESVEDPVKTPYLVESEVLSPMATLKPGESYTFHNDWYAAKIGGSYPVIDCTPVGVTCEPLTAKVVGDRLLITGRFGVFPAGKAELTLTYGRTRGRVIATQSVSPMAPLVIHTDWPLSFQPAGVKVVVTDLQGKEIGELANTKVQR